MLHPKPGDSAAVSQRKEAAARVSFYSRRKEAITNYQQTARLCVWCTVCAISTKKKRGGEVAVCGMVVGNRMHLVLCGAFHPYIPHLLILRPPSTPSQLKESFKWCNDFRRRDKYGDQDGNAACFNVEKCAASAPASGDAKYALLLTNTLQHEPKSHRFRPEQFWSFTAWCVCYSLQQQPFLPVSFVLSLDPSLSRSFSLFLALSAPSLPFSLSRSLALSSLPPFLTLPE